MNCPFCHNEHLRLTYAKKFSRWKSDYGPFDIYTCTSCGSVSTHPLPSKEQLREFYSFFESGMPASLRALRETSDQTSLYKSYLDLVSPVAAALPRDFEWLEVGAGQGEFACLMSQAFPESRGTLYDFHPRPTRVTSQTLNWQQRDLNGPFAEKKFDLVLSFAVLEHVRSPADFLGQIALSLKPTGSAVLVFPQGNALFAKALGEKWPYYSPGEHLNMPSLKGCLSLGSEHFEKVACRRFAMKYSLRYCLSYVGLRQAARILPDVALPLPVGAMSLIARGPKTGGLQ